MPVYEYYCKSCDGIFETVRPIARASEAAPCPVCARTGGRIMPTSFAAFTMREGYPRAIPDRGTYWHLGKEVKHAISGPTRMNEHPEINKPEPKRRKSKGELEISREKRRLEAAQKRRMRADGVGSFRRDVRFAKAARDCHHVHVRRRDAPHVVLDDRRHALRRVRIQEQESHSFTFM